MWKNIYICFLEKYFYFGSVVTYDIAQNSRSFNENIFMFLFSFCPYSLLILSIIISFKLTFSSIFPLISSTTNLNPSFFHTLYIQLTTQFHAFCFLKISQFHTLFVFLPQDSHKSTLCSHCCQCTLYSIKCNPF